MNIIGTQRVAAHFAPWVRPASSAEEIIMRITIETRAAIILGATILVAAILISASLAGAGRNVPMTLRQLEAGN